MNLYLVVSEPIPYYESTPAGYAPMGDEPLCGLVRANGHSQAKYLLWKSGGIDAGYREHASIKEMPKMQVRIKAKRIGGEPGVVDEYKEELAFIKEYGDGIWLL